MTLTHARLVAVLAALASPASAAAEPAPANAAGTMTLSQALDHGLARSPDLAISKKSIAAAEAHLSADRALRLPAVKVEASLLRWDDEIAIEFAPGMPPLVAREQITRSASASASLPLSGQLAINRLVNAGKAGVDAARADQRAATTSLAVGIAQAYLGVLLARAQADIAGTRVTQVDAQLTRARALAEAGVLKRVDVLRLEAALAGARREVIAAHATTVSAAEQLALLIGLPPGQQVAVVDDLAAEPAAPPVDPAAAERGALASRADLVAGRARTAQAHAAAAAARVQLLPNLLAIGNVTNQKGAGPFQPENAWYVGLALDWNLWDWGRTWQRAEEAEARADQAEMLADRERDRARVAARGRARQAAAAYESLGVARAGGTAAEEAYRIQAVRFGEGDATTTDLLQAEAELAQARLAQAQARHAYFAELAALAEVTGQRPDALLAQVGAGTSPTGTPNAGAAP